MLCLIIQKPIYPQYARNPLQQARNATNCLSLFVLDLEWRQGVGLLLCLLEKIPVGLWVSMSCLDEAGAGWSTHWCQGRRPIAQVLVLPQICPVAFMEPGNGVSHTLVYLLIVVGWGWSRRSIKNSQGLAALVLGFFSTVGRSAADAGNDLHFLNFCMYL